MPRLVKGRSRRCWVARHWQLKRHVLRLTKRRSRVLDATSSSLILGTRARDQPALPSGELERTTSTDVAACRQQQAATVVGAATPEIRCEAPQIMMMSAVAHGKLSADASNVDNRQQGESETAGSAVQGESRGRGAGLGRGLNGRGAPTPAGRGPISFGRGGLGYSCGWLKLGAKKFREVDVAAAPGEDPGFALEFAETGKQGYPTVVHVGSPFDEEQDPPVKVGDYLLRANGLDVIILTREQILDLLHERPLKLRFGNA